MGSRDLTPHMEQQLSKVIVGLHLHKQHLKECRVNSFIHRCGWGAFKQLLARCNNSV